MRPSDATPEMIRQMKRDNERFPDHLVELPESAWPSNPSADAARARLSIIKVFRSRCFIAQIHRISDSMVRLTANRTEIVGTRWKAGISWDELQLLKRQAGYGDRDAVEVYPADHDVVNVGNLRHLWIYLDSRLQFAWRQRPSCPCTSHDARECIQERYPINERVNVPEVCGCACHTEGGGE